MHYSKFQHKSLKIENIMLNSREVVDLCIRISEFGLYSIAKRASGDTFVQGEQQTVEVVRRNRGQDIRSIGKIAFSLLTGQHFKHGPQND